jgi:hypothetical protein
LLYISIGQNLYGLRFGDSILGIGPKL